MVAINVSDEMQTADYAVALNSKGMVDDYLLLPPLPNRREEREGRAYKRKLLDFVLNASTKTEQVHAIVVNNSAGMNSRKMMEIVAELVDLEVLESLRSMCNDNDSDDGDEHVEPQVVYSYVNDEVAQIFSTSPRAEREFPEYPPTLRQAIALGRYLQDPLDEMCSLWIEGAGQRGEEARELRMLAIHPLQVRSSSHFLPQSPDCASHLPPRRRMLVRSSS